jgi:hypothetical protein
MVSYQASLALAREENPNQQSGFFKSPKRPSANSGKRNSSEFISELEEKEPKKTN